MFVPFMIKRNINKIDYDLNNLFESVGVKEKAFGSQFYFELDVESTFFNLNECSEYRKAGCRFRIQKQDLRSDIITWSYSVNPLNENSDWIEITSNIDNVANDMYNIISKKRMDSEYFKSLSVVTNSINESFDTVVEVKKDVQYELSDIVNQLGIKVINTDKRLLEQVEMFSVPDEVIRVYHEGYISLPDMFRIETVLNNKPGVNMTLFKNGYIEVNVSPII